MNEKDDAATENDDNTNAINTNNNTQPSAVNSISKSNSSNTTNGKLIQEQKRRKYELKQKRKQEEQNKQNIRKDWFDQHSHYAMEVIEEDVSNVRNFLTGGNSKKEEEEEERRSEKLIELLHPYLNLKDGAPTNKKLMNTRKRKKKGHDDLSNDATTLTITGNYDEEEEERNNNEEGERRMFIAEGTETVRLLIQQSSAAASAVANTTLAEKGKDGHLDAVHKGVEVVSICCKYSTFFEEPVKLLEDVEKATHDYASTTTNNNAAIKGNNDKPFPPFQVLIGSESTLSNLAGFHIARGAMACGIVPKRDEAWLDQFLSQRCCCCSSHDKNNNNEVKKIKKDVQQQLRILALDQVSDTANLGSMIRCSAAFGINLILLSLDSCDAWYRRSVRVSMGHIFSIPIVRVQSLAHTLTKLNQCYNIDTYASVIDLDSDVLVLENLKRGNVSNESWCCVMGNEGNGISKEVSMACRYRIRIDMSGGVDSLSVPVATGILLHGLREREG